MTSGHATPDGVVDVVIPTYNNRALVMECVNALTDRAVAQAFVVDDVSCDDTLDVLARDAPGVRAVALDEHRGLAHAFNAGISAGRAPYVLFLNDDVIPVGDAIALLAGHLASNPSLVFVGGRLVDPETLETQRRYTPRAIPSASTLVARLTGIERYWRDNPWSGQHLRAPLPEDQPSEVRAQVAGACLMVRREVLETIGGWDEDFWFWYEDVDIGARLVRTGPGVWEPRALFRHLGRHSTRAWDKPDQHARLYHSTLLFARKRLSAGEGRLVGLLVAAVCLARVPSYGLRRRRRAAALLYLALARQGLAVSVGRSPGPPKALSVRRRAGTRSPRYRSHPDRDG